MRRHCFAVAPRARFPALGPCLPFSSSAWPRQSSAAWRPRDGLRGSARVAKGSSGIVFLVPFRSVRAGEEEGGESTPRFFFAHRAPLARPAASSYRHPTPVPTVLLHDAAAAGRELEPLWFLSTLTFGSISSKKKKNLISAGFIPFQPSSLSPSMGDDHGPAVGDDFKFSTGLTTAGENSLERGLQRDGVGIAENKIWAKRTCRPPCFRCRRTFSPLSF